MQENLETEQKRQAMTLTAKYVALVAPFMADKDIRYYLCGINVRPHKDGGAVIAATNGHVMGIAYDREAVVDREYTLRLDPRTATACASAKKVLKLTILNGRLTVVEGAAANEVFIQAGDPIIDTTHYPKYQNIIPKNVDLQPGLIGDFNASYIATVDKTIAAARKAGISKHSAITFFNTKGDPNRPGMVRISGCDDFLAVLMPMRGESIPCPVPDWVGLTAPSDDLAAPAEQATEAVCEPA